MDRYSYEEMKEKVDISSMLLRDPKSFPLTANVLVIDDQLTSRLIIENIVRSIGDNIKVTCHKSAVTALDVVRHYPPDLILVDYRMPEIDGVEFTRLVRAIPQCTDIPIIIITIMDDKAVMYRALDAGATDFLTKPIDHYECKARCRNLLTMQRQQIIIRERAASLERLVVDANFSIKERERETLSLVTRLADVKGDHAGDHPRRIGKISKLISEVLGMDKDFCDMIEDAAPLHDIGEVRIPSNILLKFGKLEENEVDPMRKHTTLGHQLLTRSSSPVLNFAAIIALNHHERYDGNGYPNKLKGNNIPIEGRIVAVADAFDAMMSHRNYRPAHTVDEASTILKDEKRKSFDPTCVDALIDNLNQIISINNSVVSN
jgi:two-component system response regulator RpfG